MAEPPTKPNPLDEVMLAMDVVDTLRHRQNLVERELNVEERDRQLTARLREIYAAQGIEVPDRVLQEGIAALKEDRFKYTPPPQTLSVKLARIYVNRDRWVKPLAAGMFGVAMALVLYALLIRWPAQRELAALPQKLDAEHDAIVEIAPSSEASQQAEQLLVDAQQALDRGDKRAAEAKLNELRSLRRDLERAHELREDLDAERETIVGMPQISEASAKAERLSIEGQQALENGDNAVAEETLAALKSLRSELERAHQLRKELVAESKAIVDMSRIPEASDKAEQLEIEGQQALKNGNNSVAEEKLAALKSLGGDLAREYELRIVSRPRERSGVERTPDINPNAKNYYIIVEAVDPDGRVLTLPITGEEDRKTVPVKAWGLRVEKEVYDTIAADKKDDGIIQDNVFGVKGRGYLKPEYRMPTSGSALTTW
jgi:hypothetical protein